MSEVRALIEALIERGVDPIDAAEIIARAAILGAASTPQKKSAGAIRQERYRRNKASQTVTSDASVTPDKESPPIPPKEINPKTYPPSPPLGGHSPQEFSEFWDLYPHKIGKQDAARKFAIARKRVDFETLMAGLRQYVAKTDDRPWCNPSTWLNQGRWEDRPATRQGSPPQRTGVIAAAIRKMERDNAPKISDDIDNVELLPPRKIYGP